MEETKKLQKTILHSLEGLPESRLKEIAEYIFFIRQKTLNPETFQQEFESIMLTDELTALEINEAAHLEEEFKNYKETYPKE